MDRSDHQIKTNKKRIGKKANSYPLPEFDLKKNSTLKSFKLKGFYAHRTHPNPNAR